MRGRRYLLCRPTHFDVRYSINPWMDPATPTVADTALAQWKLLHDLLVELGHTVDLIEPLPGVPDMVFAANGAIAVDGRALVARFRYPQRDAESAAYLAWFRAHGWTDVQQAAYRNEGEGDFLLAGRRILAGTGFRSEPRAWDEVHRFFGLPVLGLELVDPRFYHLDTALAVLDEDNIMYYPAAFAAHSREMLTLAFPDAIEATGEDAAVFGLNAVSDGHHVVLPRAANRLTAQLRERGYAPIGVELTELLKAGGGVKCCTLELRGHQDPAR